MLVYGPVPHADWPNRPMKPPRRISTTSNERTVTPFPAGWWPRWRARFAAFHLRESWWRLLDFFEARRAARVALYLTAATMVSGSALWYWAYPAWKKHSAIRIARQWLASGHLRYAADAAQKAAELNPESPEPWQIAAELARKGRQWDKALEYSRRAAELGPDDPAAPIAVAADALNAGRPADAIAALALVPAEALAASAEAQRILGELARREAHLTEARDHFAAALQLDGPKAINEIPLGLVLLRSTVPAERQQGLALLGHWTGDPEWGPTALRTLLADALERQAREPALRWAEALRAHPRITVGDMPAWLLALARYDHVRYAAALAQLEKDHAVSPAAAAQLLDWLNQIGRSQDAADWLKTLPAPAMRRPPLAVLAAESFRASGAWADLSAWTETGNWGPETEFLRWTYGLFAAQMRHDETRADELWRTLYGHAQLNTGHALFAASTLYSWGRVTEPEALWWRAADQEGGNAIQALGALARYYQVKRDADGQYRAFRRLHLLQPQDAAIANNFAFFGLLLNHEERIAAKIARTNLEQYPDNYDYLATQAFSLLQQGHPADALQLLKPKASLAARSPGLAFAYGLALARNGRKLEARNVLDHLPPASLTITETELIKAVLAD